MSVLRLQLFALHLRSQRINELGFMVYLEDHLSNLAKKDKIEAFHSVI